VRATRAGTQTSGLPGGAWRRDLPDRRENSRSRDATRQALRPRLTAARMACPWLLNRVGLDAALGSGPIATVIQDLLSIAAYFTIVMRRVA
jgi:hypothetical protein